jgi:hypothetical protein
VNQKLRSTRYSASYVAAIGFNPSPGKGEGRSRNLQGGCHEAFQTLPDAIRNLPTQAFQGAQRVFELGEILVSDCVVLSRRIEGLSVANCWLVGAKLADFGAWLAHYSRAIVNLAQKQEFALSD